eukprot:10383050-Ditylum_brightwellii.AAC.1
MTKEKYELDVNVVKEGTMEIEDIYNVDDKVIGEELMDTEETSKVEENMDAEVIAKCTGVAASTESEGKD